MFDVKKYIKGNYVLTTHNGKLNYKGVTLKYFEKEFNNPDKQYKEETLITYGAEYENKIFNYFNDNVAVDDIPEKFYVEVEERLTDDYGISDVTVEHTQHSLITRLVELYFDDPNTITKSPFKGSSSNFIKKNKNKDINEVILKIPKSLSIEQFDNLFDTLVEDPRTSKGSYPALGATCCLGIRLNEAAGASFKSILESINHVECFYLVIIETSKLDSQKIKILGKSFNAQRRLFLIERYKNYILERREFIKSQLTFPLKDNVGNTINSVDDLPIGCISDKYNYRCGTVYLSKEGKELLLEVAKMSEDSLGAIETQIKTNEEYVEYKDVTTYVLRRNWLTQLRILGLTDDQIEYWAGHSMEDSNMSRGMFGNEDNLYKIYERISKHPINKQQITKAISINNMFTQIENESSVELSFNEQEKYLICITEKEINDGVTISGNLCDKNAYVTSFPYSNKPNETTNITKQLNREFSKVRNKKKSRSSNK